MPVISRFLGISIEMYYSDHAPPHFHARYGEFMVSVEIESGVVKGALPLRVLRLVQEWRALRLDQLRSAWQDAEADQTPRPITGLV
jgi:hypothetical protein